MNYLLQGGVKMELIFNPDCLSYEEIKKFVSRVKILIINDFNQLLLCNIDGIYYFVGGHIEEGETIIDALKRETLEETGIFLQEDFNISPFLVYKFYNKNHYGTTIKCLSTINYCSVKTNTPFNLDNLRLDANELKKIFLLEYVSLDNIEEKLLESVSTPEQESLVNEMIDVISYFRTKHKSLRKELKGRSNE